MHYNGFAPVGCYLVDRHSIKELFWYFIDKFPFIYSVLALTVSSPHSRGDCVELSSYFREDDDNSEDNDNDSKDVSGVDESGDYDELTKKERAILEFFIAQL